MLPWLVITADGVSAGRGVRGYTLAWFLRTYFGRRNVRIASPAVLRAQTTTAETVFVGLPTTLTPDEIERLLGGGRYHRVVLFDYLDEQRLAWTAEQEPAFRAASRHYLKPWLERVWTYGLQMGTLPIRRSRRLSAAILCDRIKKQLPRGKGGAGTSGERHLEHDVAFLGQPNDTRIIENGQTCLIDQRFDWLSELYQHRDEFKFWGGFVGGDPRIIARLEQEYGDFSHLYYTDGKIGFSRYFRALRASRVLLAPGGNAPWTYRHYECLYAGGMVVTIDFRQRDMLVPLPEAGVIHVPDGASVVPYVREAIELDGRDHRAGQKNIAHLEQYLHFGNYSRSRPKLLERFVAQIE